MHLRNGLKISLNQSITHNGVTYPAPVHPNWFTLLGITEVVDPVLPDDFTHTYTENPDGSITPIERPLDEVKRRRIRQFKNQESALFDEKYDLLDAILVLSGQAPAGRTTTFKADILALEGAFKTAKAAVNAATTLAAVMAVVPVWPVI